MLACHVLISAPTYGGPHVWTTGGPYGGYVNALVIDTTNPATLYAGTGNGVFKSTDGGLSWKAKNVGLEKGIDALALDPSNPSRLYAASYEVFRSTDGGDTWAELPVEAEAVTIDPVTPSILYAGSYAGTGHVFRSTDYGDSWVEASSGLTEAVLGVAIDPLTPTLSLIHI